MEQGFGAFGKMPSVGDFFRVTAPGGFVSVWDDWLQTGILSTRQRLGDRWDEHYMSAPIWRFVLAAGLAGPQKVLGILMPSVDRVGRQFPLTLMTAMPGDDSPAHDHFNAKPAFEELENLALDALSETMTRDLLIARLSQLSPPPPVAPAPVRSIAGTLILSQPSAPTFLPDLAAGLVMDRFRQPSIWSAEIDDGYRVMTCEGLPNEPHMQGLFDLNAPIWTEAKPL